MNFERLEERINPSLIVGTEGNDIAIVFNQENINYVLFTVQNNIQSLGFQTAPDSLTFDLKGGNDLVYNISSNAVDVILGEGNDSFVDGGEGAGSYIDGGPGNDSILGGKFNDTIIGGTGLDSLNGGNGDDYIVGGNLLHKVNLDSSEKSLNIVNLQRYGQPQDDGELDLINGGSGFNVIFNDIERNIEIVLPGSRIISVSNTSEFQNAINGAASGDQIFLQNGIYTNKISKNLAGVTITGSGPETILTNVFQVNNGGSDNPLLIENLTIDLTGLSANNWQGSSVLNSFKNGVFYLDEVEVRGEAVTNTASLYFSALSDELTKGVIANSYIHNVYGDGVSTGGGTGFNQNSIVEVYDTIGHTAGPNSNNQLLTAHFGFKLVAVGGSFSDAANNVVAPDNVSVIDLYYVSIFGGPRSANISFELPNVVYGCYLETDSISTKGILENNTIILSYQTTAIQAKQGAVIKNNIVINYFTSGFYRGVALRENNICVIDNVFENFNNNCLYIFAGTTGHTLENNLIS